jgi:hypothetical protein
MHIAAGGGGQDGFINPGRRHQSLRKSALEPYLAFAEHAGLAKDSE